MASSVGVEESERKDLLASAPKNMAEQIKRSHGSIVSGENSRATAQENNTLEKQTERTQAL